MFSLRRMNIFRKAKILRHLSTSTCGTVVSEPLEKRSLLRVSGSDVYGFLQGLMTNDISHVQSGISSMYTMFLNTKGRVLYDAIIYQTAEPEVLFIECDNLAMTDLEKHLKVYRLRKKVSIDVEDGYKVWAVYNPVLNENLSSGNLVSEMKDKLLGKVLPSEELELGKRDRKESFSINSITSKNTVSFFRDPRIYELGLRVICPTSEDVSELLRVGKGSSYRSLRFYLGVGEGILDLPPGEGLALECNCDYLHGVSFHKGCYIGQELTARVYHTGVVRKRLMPLVLDSSIGVESALKQEVLNENSKPVGKLLGVEGLTGLGLMRIAEVLSAKSLSLCSTSVKTRRPNWWPNQAPKELESRDKQ